MNPSQRLRARIGLICALIAAGLLAASLYWTQVVKGPSYAARAQAQYVRPAGSLFDRGTIFFEPKDGGRIAAATVSSGFVAYMNPTAVKDPEGEYDAVSGYLKLDKADFIRRAAKPNDHYEELAKQVDSATAASIQGLALPGIGVVSETWRSYPGGDLASHLLGLVGEDESSSVPSGKYGLERSYESVLSRPPSGTSNVFASLFSGFGSVFANASPDEGDVVTGIEPAVETYLQKLLSDTVSTWHSDEIGGIVMDPNTGQIVAMASLPTFDPNDTSGVKDIGVLTDPMVQHVYELGSIMKPLTMATALDTGAVSVDTTYNDTGCMTLDKKKICNYDGRARGVIPMQQILSQSLNVGAATIALKVGKDGMNAYFNNFGLATTTGIDLPGEARGITGNLKAGKDIDVATASYGQGIAVTPVNMARALSILANGGYVVTPHVAAEIDYSDGRVVPVSPPRSAPVLKLETVNAVRQMLIKVVDGTMAPAHADMNFDHYSVAAKTGTAEIADHVNGGYYKDRYLHSFFGFFPATSPRFLVFLYQIYPKGAQYASETLTDPFAQMAKFLMNYYNIPPDR